VSVPAVYLRGVVKRFGRGDGALTAVDHLDLEVATGTCFGLLGPNGAGKSTAMRLLTGQAIADEGDVEVLGHRLPVESKAARARCGVVPQVDNLDDELTVAENLAVYARFHGVPRRQRAAAIAHGLDIAELAGRADSRADDLSGGMRRRLLIARGLLHRPELVLLDEPTVGLDPQIRAQLWAQVDAIRVAGATVVLTTHYIEEAERLCDEVAIIHDGRIVARGRPADLVASHVGTEVLEVAGPAADLAAIAARAAAAGFATRSAGTAVAVLGAERVNGDLALAGRRRAATLEDVFVVLTGEQL
jgi:lipooligosaccharide transport system ATP-binding protein